MKTSLRSLTNALLLVGMGFALFYLGPAVRELMRGERDQPELLKAPLLADSPQETAGNHYLYQCLVNLERRRSLATQAVQTGVVNDRLVESTGEYLQVGQGQERRFRWRLQGRVTDEPVTLDQVSDGESLWTDLAWGEASEASLRRVWRVDLRSLRKSLAQPAAENVRPGEAAAAPLDPNMWASLGGLPMLLESLKTNFDFAQPRSMYYKNQPVYAMIGFWKKEQRDRLLETEDGAGAEPTERYPARLPHHVLVAIGVSDLFPYLVEYRSAEDALSQATLSVDDRFRESRRPMLKLELKPPRFDVEIDANNFAYKPPPDVNWMDRTAERLAMLKSRQRVALMLSRRSPK
ncbi:MAG: hypothetical protein KDA37_02855 [Planctomycetales bacterium]|nr:hypothetical protein [Planctomycetales bacterium]